MTTLSYLRQIDEDDFEDFVADLWERYDWKSKVTSGSNDGGIDVIVKKKEPVRQKHAIQVKRFAEGNKISAPQVRQYNSIRSLEQNTDSVIVLTTSSFSDPGEDEAEDLNVKMVDGPRLYDIIDNVEAEDLVLEYVSIDDPQETEGNKMPKEDQQRIEKRNTDGVTIDRRFAENKDIAELQRTRDDDMSKDERSQGKRVDSDGDNTDNTYYTRDSESTCPNCGKDHLKPKAQNKMKCLYCLETYDQ